MVADRTPEFRQYVRDFQTSLSPNTPKKPRRSNHGAHENEQLSRATSVAYMQDAYTIVNIWIVGSRDSLLTNPQLKHIQALTKVLAVIKRPYLNVEANDMVTARDSGAVVDLMADGITLGSLKRLSSQQRDQADLQAKMIITQCAERVRAMEQVEKSSYQPQLHIKKTTDYPSRPHRTCLITDEQTLTPTTSALSTSNKLRSPVFRFSCSAQCKCDVVSQPAVGRSQPGPKRNARRAYQTSTRTDENIGICNCGPATSFSFQVVQGFFRKWAMASGLDSKVSYGHHCEFRRVR